MSPIRKIRESFGAWSRLDTESPSQQSPCKFEFDTFLPFADLSRIGKAISEPLGEEIKTANRLIDGQHSTNPEIVTEGLNRGPHAVKILQVFTSGTMNKYEDNLRLTLHEDSLKTR